MLLKLKLLYSHYSNYFFQLVLHLSVAAILWLVLFAYAFYHYSDALDKVRLTSFNSRLDTLKRDVLINYAITGVWQTRADNQSAPETVHHYQFDQISTKQGSFTEQYTYLPTAENRFLSYSLTSSSALQPTLFWLCGYQDARPDETVSAENPTSVPKNHLSHICQRSPR
jgi:hypothetical protein